MLFYLIPPAKNVKLVDSYNPRRKRESGITGIFTIETIGSLDDGQCISFFKEMFCVDKQVYPADLTHRQYKVVPDVNQIKDDNFTAN